jgi:hypothetical protein
MILLKRDELYEMIMFINSLTKYPDKLVQSRPVSPLYKNSYIRVKP